MIALLILLAAAPAATAAAFSWEAVTSIVLTLLLVMLGWLARAIARIDVKGEEQTAGLRAEIQALDERMDGKFTELYECLRAGYVTHDLCAAYRQASQTQEDE